MMRVLRSAKSAVAAAPLLLLTALPGQAQQAERDPLGQLLGSWSVASGDGTCSYEYMLIERPGNFAILTPQNTVFSGTVTAYADGRVNLNTMSSEGGNPITMLWSYTSDDEMLLEAAIVNGTDISEQLRQSGDLTDLYQRCILPLGYPATLSAIPPAAAAASDEGGGTPAATDPDPRGKPGAAVPERDPGKITG